MDELLRSISALETVGTKLVVISKELSTLAPGIRRWRRRERAREDVLPGQRRRLHRRALTPAPFTVDLRKSES
jgi:hypothetical protein